MKWLKITIVTIFSLFILGAFLFETKMGKQFVVSMLLKALDRTGVHVEVGEISGDFPQEIDASDVRIAGIGRIGQLHLELSVLPLMAGEIRIHQLKADGIELEKQANISESKGIFPLAINIRSFELTHVQAPDLPELALTGSFFMRRGAKSAYLEGTLTRYDIPDAKLKFEVARNRFGKVESDFELSSKSWSVFKPWVEEDFAASDLYIHAHIRGTPNAFTGMIDGKFLAPDGQAWSFKSRARKEIDHPIQFQKMVASTHGLRISGEVNLNECLAFDRAYLQVRLNLEHVGTLFASGSLIQTTSGLEAKAIWRSPEVHVSGLVVTDASGSIEGMVDRHWFNGTIAAQANSLQTKWSLNTPLMLRYGTEKSATFEDFQLDSDPLAMHGTVTWIDSLWIGKLEVDRVNLSLIDSRLTGLARGSVTLATDNGKQQIETDLTGSHLAFGPFTAYAAHVTTDGPRIQANLERLKWQQIGLDTAYFNADGEQFSLDAEGQLLQLALTGRWCPCNAFLIESGQGRLIHHPLSLLAPTKLTWSSNSFAWSELRLSIGPGILSGSYQQTEETLDAQVSMKHMPLNILSLNPMESRAEGTFDANATLKRQGEKTDADWSWTLENGRIENQPEFLTFEEPPEPLTLAGHMEGSLHNENLQLKTQLQVKASPFLSLDLTTPFHLDADWHPSFPPGAPSGTLKVNGNLEDGLDFLDLGMHRVAGKVDCDLTLSRGRVHGTCTIQDGYYQNYVTGTELSHLSADCVGSEDRLILKSLTANDLHDTEVLYATGSIHLSLRDLFPFHFDVKFDHLNLVQIDLVTAEAEGHLSIDGNLQSALAIGAVQVSQTDISIPTHIPRSYPDLQVIYKHRPIQATIASTPKLPYPLGLDLKIDAPKAVFINGRGVTSEWNGEFAIGGTYAEPSVNGSLNLIDGEFSFAGRRFKLTQGSLSMHGNDYQLPLIDLSAQTTEKAISITARLKGPINRPQLTFQSVPPLPLSAILSHLLFGKDLSDVTGLQALQLAGTVASVAGEGPDILEITRKSLGVDRLQIVMTPSGSGEGYDGKETIALEIGKILTPGVILTIKQSANDSNPDIGIEVDLTHGFVLEAASEQQPEQGKFSLKWNVNY